MPIALGVTEVSCAVSTEVEGTTTVSAPAAAAASNASGLASAPGISIAVPRRRIPESFHTASSRSVTSLASEVAPSSCSPARSARA